MATERKVVNRMPVNDEEKVIAIWDSYFENGEQINKFYCPECSKKADIKSDTPIICYTPIEAYKNTQIKKCESCGKSLLIDKQSE